MGILNVIIPTLGLWVLEGTLIMPLARELSAASTRKQASRRSTMPTMLTLAESKSARETMEPSPRIYIGVSVAILGLAGLICGFAGYPLVGFATRARSWPGMLAMIFGSFLGFGIIT